MGARRISPVVTLAVACIILATCLFEVAHTRPNFPHTPVELRGSAHPDADGVFRHSSTEVRKRGESSQAAAGVHFEYEARISQELIRVDHDLTIDTIVCSKDMNELYITVTSSSSISTWTEGHVIVGGTEWGCLRDLQVSPISVKIGKITQKTETLFVVSGEFFSQEKIFDHLEMKLSLDDEKGKLSMQTSGQATPTPEDFFSMIPEPTEPVMLEDYVEPTPSSNEARAATLSVYSPTKSDIFVDGDVITVQWNTDGISGTSVYVSVLRDPAGIFTPVQSLFGRILVNNTGSYSFPPVPTKTTANQEYYTQVEDCTGNNCNKVQSSSFSINTAPDVLFTSPARGDSFFLGNTINVQAVVHDKVTSSSITVFLMTQRPKANDLQVASTSVKTPSNGIISLNFTVDSGYKSSNAYFIMVQYNCFLNVQALGCVYQTSELFSVIPAVFVPSTNLYFVTPSAGDSFFTSTSVSLAWVSNFTADTSIVFTLYQRRVGWDSAVSTKTIVHPANQSRVDALFPVSSSWTASTGYYVLAKWGCAADQSYCQGSQTSKDFSVNVGPKVQFSLLPKVLYPQTNHTFAWTSSLPANTQITVKICADRPILWDDCYTYTTVNSNAGQLVWPVIEKSKNLLWSYYVSFEHSCVLGILCSSVNSPRFRIYNELETFYWNTDAEGNIKKPVIDVVNLDCKAISTACAILDSQSQFVLCQLCNVAGFYSHVGVQCLDCWISDTVGLYDLSLNINMGTVAGITANITNQISGKLNFDIVIPAAYSDSIYQPIYSHPLFALPSPIQIAGFSLTLGIYADIAVRADIDIGGALTATVAVNIDQSSSIIVDSAKNVWNVSLLEKKIDLPDVEITSLWATGQVKVGPLATIRLGVMTFPQVLGASIWAYLDNYIDASYPPLDPLPPGTVPENRAIVKLLTSVCQQPHYLEDSTWAGVDVVIAAIIGVPIWGYQFPLFNIPVVSGCFIAEGDFEKYTTKLALTIQDFDTKDWNMTTLQGIVQFDVANALAIPKYTILATVWRWLNPSKRSDGTTADGQVILNVIVGPQANNTNGTVSRQLQALAADKNSALYSSDRIITSQMSYINDTTDSSSSTGASSTTGVETSTTGVAQSSTGSAQSSTGSAQSSTGSAQSSTSAAQSSTSSAKSSTSSAQSSTGSAPSSTGSEASSTTGSKNTTGSVEPSTGSPKTTTGSATESPNAATTSVVSSTTAANNNSTGDNNNNNNNNSNSNLDGNTSSAAIVVPCVLLAVMLLITSF